jgi:hypothetical protein
MEEQQFAALLKDCGDTGLNLCLSAAEAAMSSGEFADADRMFRRGLEWSERRFGAQSAAVGLVLMSMINLYQMDGTGRSTEKLERRLRDILRRYFFTALAAEMNDES